MQLKLDALPGLRDTIYAGKTLDISDDPNGFSPFSRSSMECYADGLRDIRTQIGSVGVNRRVIDGSSVSTLGALYVHRAVAFRGRMLASVQDLEQRSALYLGMAADPYARDDFRREVKHIAHTIRDVYGDAFTGLLGRLKQLYVNLNGAKAAYEAARENASITLRGLADESRVMLHSSDIAGLRETEKRITDGLAGINNGLQNEFSAQSVELRKLREQIRARARAAELHHEVAQIKVTADRLLSEEDGLEKAYSRVDSLQSAIANASLPERLKTNYTSRLKDVRAVLDLTADVQALGGNVRAQVTRAKYNAPAIESLDEMVAALQVRVAHMHGDLKEALTQRLSHARDSIAEYRNNVPSYLSSDGEADELVHGQYWDPSGSLLRRGVACVDDLVQGALGAVRSAQASAGKYVLSNGKRILAGATLAGAVVAASMQAENIGALLKNDPGSGSAYVVTQSAGAKNAIAKHAIADIAENNMTADHAVSGKGANSEKKGDLENTVAAAYAPAAVTEVKVPQEKSSWLKALAVGAGALALTALGFVGWRRRSANAAYQQNRSSQGDSQVRTPDDHKYTNPYATTSELESGRSRISRIGLTAVADKKYPASTATLYTAVLGRREQENKEREAVREAAKQRKAGQKRNEARTSRDTSSREPSASQWHIRREIRQRSEAYHAKKAILRKYGTLDSPAAAAEADLAEDRNSLSYLSALEARVIECHPSHPKMVSAADAYKILHELTDGALAEPDPRLSILKSSIGSLPGSAAVDKKQFSSVYGMMAEQIIAARAIVQAQVAEKEGATPERTSPGLDASLEQFAETGEGSFIPGDLQQVIAQHAHPLDWTPEQKSAYASLRLMAPAAAVTNAWQYAQVIRNILAKKKTASSAVKAA